MQMTWAHTRRSENDYRAAPSAIQKAFDKQVRLLVLATWATAMGAVRTSAARSHVAAPGVGRWRRWRTDAGLILRLFGG
jgi:hypothetical protein